MIKQCPHCQSWNKTYRNNCRECIRPLNPPAKPESLTPELRAAMISVAFDWGYRNEVMTNEQTLKVMIEALRRIDRACDIIWKPAELDRFIATIYEEIHLRAKTEADECVNTLMHIADDHPCCAPAIRPVVTLLNSLHNSIYSSTRISESRFSGSGGTKQTNPGRR